MTALQYVVIIVDSSQSHYEVSRTDDTLVEVYPVGYAFCGLHFKGTRPTTVIRAYSPLTDEKQLSWEREHLPQLGGIHTKWI